LAAEHLRQVAVVTDRKGLATPESAQILTQKGMKHVDVVLSGKAVRVKLGRERRDVFLGRIGGIVLSSFRLERGRA
jgi:hypothetical protein